MAEKITIRDLLKYRFPGNLQYSPDGKTLAFQVSRSDEKENTYRTDVWLIRNGRPAQLTSTADASIVLWQDNTHLILSRRTKDTVPGTTELYRMDINGGEALPYCVLPFGMSSLKETEPGEYIASGMIDAEDPDAYLDSEETRKKKLEAKKSEQDYTVVDEIPYWFNGRGFINKQRSALFEVRFEPELSVKRITPAKRNAGSWKYYHGKIYYTGTTPQRHRLMTDKLYAYDPASGRTETVYGKNDLSMGSLVLIKDTLYVQASNGKAYGVNETDAFMRVDEDGLTYVMKPEYGLHNSVGGDILGSSAQSKETGDAWYTLATEEDHTVVYRFDEKLNLKKIFDMPGAVSGLSVGKKIALLREDAVHGPEIWEIDKNGKNLTKLTSLNDEALAGKYIAEPVRIDYASEGEQLHGWVLLPEDFDTEKQYPAVLDIHGGPRTVYGEVFFHEMQVWAAKGYVVFFTNIRGSDGRGDAFADIRDQYGEVDFRNLMDFTDAVLQAYPNIDPKRVCETGGSYGGFMTNWIIGHTDRFCCAASQRSISNWISFSWISDIGPYFGPDQCGAKDIYRDTEYLWNHSPLKYADQVNTPTLFIHSDEDYRCPLPEGMQMMQALAQRNVETRLVIFHGENHELSRSGKPLHRIRRLQEITDWFDKHTK